MSNMLQNQEVVQTSTLEWAKADHVKNICFILWDLYLFHKVFDVFYLSQSPSSGRFIGAHVS